MRIDKAIDFQNVEALSRELKAERASTERFSIEIPARDCANAIYASFRQEVEQRGGRFVMDEGTKAHILAAAEWLTDPGSTPGLILCGLYGNGKTTLALAIQRLVGWLTGRELGYTNRKIVRFAKAKEIVRLMRTDPKAYDSMFREEMLIIDELGEEPKEVMTYGTIDTPMADLISERYDRRLFTIITTNLDAGEIKAKYGERIYDRFKEMLTSIVFENESYRKKN